MNEATRAYIAELEGQLAEIKDALDDAVIESQRLRNALDRIAAILAALAKDEGRKE